MLQSSIKPGPETTQDAYSVTEGLVTPTPSVLPTSAEVRTSKWSYLVSGVVYLTVMVSAATTLFVVVTISRRRARMARSQDDYRKSEFVCLIKVDSIFF